MRTTDTHVYFWGDYMSQWHESPFEMRTFPSEAVATKFNCCEQWMMYIKARYFNDMATAAAILATNDPQRQKALGRSVKNYDDVSWSKIRYQVVVDGNLRKFTQNPELGEMLKATGDRIIVEGSPYDKVWGVGLLWSDDRILDEKNWRGENLLGKALMKVREKIR